jgi:hypothetical protein
MSEVKENADTHSTPSSKGRTGEGLVRSVSNVVSGSFLSDESTLRNFPFVLFLSFLGILYITYGYYSDDQVRKVNQLTSEIKELRTQYIVAKDSLVVKSKQTEVAKALVQTGIKESVVPPKKILVATPNPTKGEE